MELWIRSQNKEVLAKVKELYVVNGVKCDNLEDGYDIENADFRFGRYKTKERTLEVLDEIQTKIAKLSYQEHFIGKDFIGIESKVYEMPKE